MASCCTTDQCHSQQHIAIIGTGSGAFAAAIKASENGAKVSIIEAADIIGGTCVNIGCVPSKIMIRGAHIAQLQKQHNIDGIALHQPVVDRSKMVQQQQDWVTKLRFAKYEKILQDNEQIELIRGHARFKNNSTLLIERHNGEKQELTADKILIAVGARPKIPDIDGLQATPYWTSTEALVAEKLPKHLVVVGGSVIALELAQAFLRLGSKVTLMARSTLLSKEDPQIGEALMKILQKEGMEIKLHHLPDKIAYQDQQFTVSFHGETTTCDQLLIATGRQSNADKLALENTDIKTTAEASILVDNYLQTSVSNIYAVGDCTALPQYVYVAAAAGTRAGRNMSGEKIQLDLSVLPTVVFTEPQVACVGLDEKTAQQQNIDYQSRTLPLENVPRALANLNTDGFIKMVINRQNRQIIGCQIVADQAGEVIQSAAFAIANKMTVEQLANQLFPYLTMVEGLKLTAQTFSKDISQLSCCAG